MGRRPNGSGGISWREDRKKYEGILNLGRNPETGKPIRKYFYGNTQTEVTEKMKEYEILHIGCRPDNTTFRMLSLRWLNTQEGSLKPKSYQRYEGVINNYVSDAPWYDDKIKDIKYSDVDTFLRRTPASPHTTHLIHRIIKSIFTVAVNDEIILRNPCDKIKLKPPEALDREDVKAWTREEQKIFMDYIQKSDEKFKNLFIIALFTGARLGELTALTWKDLKGDSIKINKSVSRQRTDKDKKIYEYVVGGPKTYTSKREIPLSQKAMEVLKGIKKENDLIFFDEKTGSFIFPKGPVRHLQRICQELNIPRLTFHHLRSTYATRLFEAGVSLKTVQKLLGHSTLEMTEKMYVQVMKDNKKEAVQKLDDLFL